MGETVRGMRVPDGAKGVRELAPGEYLRTKEGWWYVRPPDPGYVQHLNAAAYHVTVEASAHPDGGLAPISVAEPIVQRGGRWRLEAGEWRAEPEG